MKTAKYIIRVITGLNLASLRHLLLLRWSFFLAASDAAFHAVRHARIRSFDDIPEIGLGEILGDRTVSISIPVQRYQDGMISNEEAMALLAIMAAERPAIALEIGTFMGRTTRMMAENSLNSIIHTVDLPPDFSKVSDLVEHLKKDDYHLIGNRDIGRDFMDSPLQERIIQHFADTAVWDFAQAGNPSFIFIDGSHTYDYCRNDSEKCINIASPRAVVLWHDCNQLHPGVLKYLWELRNEGLDIRNIRGTSLAYLKLS